MKTKLSKSQKVLFNEYTQNQLSDHKNLGQTEDYKPTEVNKFQTTEEEFAGVWIGVRYCSPNHAGEKPSFYWFVINY